MAILLSLSLSLSPPPPNPNPNTIVPRAPTLSATCRRHLVLRTSSLFLLSIATHQWPIGNSLAAAESPAPEKPAKSALAGIVNTKSWFRFYGDGFAIRVPPEFQDIMEPEDYNAGSSLYGDKVKPKTYAARFASSDGSEVLSVIIKPTNQLKITFLEAQDITDLGSLKDAAKIFVPVRSSLYSARAIKIKEDEGFRTYYFYEFGNGEQHVALVAAVNSGKAIVAGATAPQSKWSDEGTKLRSAAISMTVL